MRPLKLLMPLRGAPSMKLRLLLSLTLSMLASTAFAMPATEQAVSAQAKTVPVNVFNTVAETSSGRLIQQYQRVAEGGADHLAAQHRRDS